MPCERLKRLLRSGWALPVLRPRWHRHASARTGSKSFGFSAVSGAVQGSVEISPWAGALYGEGGAAGGDSALGVPLHGYAESLGTIID